MRQRFPIFLCGLMALLLAGNIGALLDSAAPPRAAAQPAVELEAVLAQDVTKAYEPVSPTTEFSELAKKIYLVLKSESAKGGSIKATWRAVNVEGAGPDYKLGRCISSSGGLCSLSLRPGQRGAIWLEPPRGGFLPGDYQVDLAVRDDVVQSLPFKVVQILPTAPLLEQARPIRGVNIALAALGGKVEASTSQYDDKASASTALIDGLNFTFEGRKCRTSCGWESKDATFPQEIVFSFFQGREAMISTVVIGTAAYDAALYGGDHLFKLPKHVEIWASTTSATDGFSRIAGARLQRRPAQHLIALPPTRAKYVQVVFLSNYGGTHNTQAAEIKIIEATEAAPSIVSEVPKNLALPALGGAIVRFTSKGQHDPAGHLIDGTTETADWRSEDKYLPQDIVFAFHGEQIALIDRIVLNPGNAPDRYKRASWPKVVSVAVSAESPFDGFEEVGRFTLAQEPRDQEFSIGRPARFVKLRILETFGEPYAENLVRLGEVKLFEGSAPGYESILLRPEATAVSSATASLLQLDESGMAVETEPNNTPTEANPLQLGQWMKGTIDPLGEEDYFTLSLPDGAASVLTLELLGRPNIRTSLSLLDATGEARKQFDPAQRSAPRALFSWAVAPGQHLVKVTAPPAAIVLIWDTSGSMGKDNLENLQQAVEGYLDQVQPTERLNLIRFSGQVEVLLGQFTDDRDQLKAAVQGKFAAEGGTSFYDAVAKGIELLGSVQGNRAIVVMTDGNDTSSQLKHPGFWRLLEEKRIRLYTIGLGGELLGYSSDIGTTGKRFLTHAALATNGRSFFAQTGEELKGLYQQIADELRTVSTYYLRPSLSRGPGRLSVVATGERVAAVSAPPQIELILDASGSMKRKIDGRMMIDIAKEAMAQIIESLPDDIQVALRIYGHRIREKQKGDCQDSELVFPFAKIDKARLLERVRAVRALGTTPIAYSLQQVERDFGNTPGEKMVILVTDGKEECKGNPAAVVSELLAKGIKIRLNIVGFALAEEAVKQEMQRIAALAGGRFFDAKDAKSLRGAIEQALAVPYEVHDGVGSKVGAGVTGQGAIELPEGIYTVVVGAAGRAITIPDVRIVHHESTTIELKKEGQEIGQRVVRAAP